MKKRYRVDVAFFMPFYALWQPPVERDLSHGLTPSR